MMTYRPIHFFLAMAALTLIVCMAPATSWSHGGAPPDPSSFIEKFDQDGDGMISADEFKGPADHFSRMDSDGDGYLTVEELQAGQPGPRGCKGGFDKDDTDNDGKVSKEEFSGPADLFEQLDADGDGYITRQEVRREKGMGRPGPKEKTESD